MKTCIPLLFIFSLLALLASCTAYKSSSPEYETVTIGYYENGSYIDTGYYAGYGYNEPKNWYGISYPYGLNNSVWYAH